MPELSIIVPVYNGALFIEDTINSILEQTYTDYELILVDDGSTDDTYKICEKYALEDDRIVLTHRENGGMSAARDTGYQMARGKWIAFLDGDDIFRRDMFETLLNASDTAQVVYTYAANIDGKRILEWNWSDSINNIAKKRSNQKIELIEHFSGRDLLENINNGTHSFGLIGCLWGMVIEHAFFDNLLQEQIYLLKGDYPQNYLNDACVIPRLFLACDRAVLVNDVSILHRISINTDSRTLKPNALHYETLFTARDTMCIYSTEQLLESYQSSVIGFYLVALKLWYQVRFYESDAQRASEYMEQIKKLYKQYYPDLKRTNRKGFTSWLLVRSIQLYNIHPSLWELLVGRVRYGYFYSKDR